MDEQRKPIEMPSADVPDYSPEINALYDAQKAQQEQSLKTAYDQNVQTLQNSKQAIAPLYNQQANDLSTQFERTRRMNNMKADYNGLNTGAASQMDLAQQSNYLDSFGKLRTAQAQAEQAVDQKLADLEISYKNSVAQALADNDYQRAAALMKEYQRRDEATKEEQRYQYNIKVAAQQYADQYARQQEQDALAKQQYEDKLAAQQWEQQYKERAYNDALSQQQNEEAVAAAKTRAAYGDFSGYEALYGPETANAMKQFWAMNNPDYAYSMGMITAAQYEQMTGYSPDRSSLYSGGYSSGGSSGGYRRSGGGGSPNPNNNPNGPGAIDGDNGNGGNLGGEITAPVEKLSTEQQLKIAAGVMSGDISADSNLRDAYYAYHMIESDAKNLVRQSGVDPNSEQGKQLVDAAVALYYKDPNVSLEDIQSLQNNRTANAQANAQQLKTESRRNREDEERLDNEKYIQSQINYGSQNGKKEVKTTSKNANGSTGKKVVQAK